MQIRTLKSRMADVLNGVAIAAGVLTALFFVYSYNIRPPLDVYSGVCVEQIPAPSLYRADDLLQELEILRAKIERMRTLKD